MTKQLRCRHRHTQDEHPKCFDDFGNLLLDRIPDKIKILVFDIETLPILAYTWGAYQQDLQIDGIVKDWVILAWSAKWLGNDKIISDVLSSKEALARDDKRLVEDCWKLLDKADIVIAHNGRAFDMKRISTRFMYHNLLPPSQYRVVDTLLAAKSVFGLTMNRQDYIAKYLGMQRKLKTEFQLWVDCDNGKKKALKNMREYNEGDVLGLEEIYLRIRPWIPSHPDLSTIANEDGCPVCMGTYYKIGIYYTQRRRYNQYRCSSCGSTFHDTKSLR